MSTERFDVSARIPSGATIRQFRAMLQNMLADQFKLTCHSETRQMQIYELTVAKGGTKLKEVATEVPPEEQATPWRPPLAPPGRTQAAKAGKRESMATIAGFISGQLDRPVIDATGLKGMYDYTLRWEIEASGVAAGPAAPSASADPAGTLPENGSEPNIVDSIREQLGLSLVQKRGPANILVVDRAERQPIGN